VKFLVAVGKLPQQALEELKRLGGEVSTDKIEGWVKNPTDSFQRSDVGKTAGQVQKVITNTTKGAADAAKRGCVGRMLSGKSC
jgi:hypothetical protein